MAKKKLEERVVAVQKKIAAKEKELGRAMKAAAKVTEAQKKLLLQEAKLMAKQQNKVAKKGETRKTHRITLGEGPTHIAVVLDRSGSMGSIRDDAINGFNTFLKDQKKEKGKATMTFTQFDNVYEIIHDMIPIKKMPELDTTTFVPRGSTALLDAVGRTITATAVKIKKMKKASRPSKVIFLILTDGMENASHEFTWASVNKLVTKHGESDKWDFLFIGVEGVDKIAKGLGIGQSNAIAMANTSIGTQSVFASMSRSMSDYRKGSVKACNYFSDGDRKKQAKLRKQAGIKS